MGHGVRSTTNNKVEHQDYLVTMADLMIALFFYYNTVLMDLAAITMGVRSMDYC